MRRNPDEAFLDLRTHLRDWLASGGRPGIHVFVYPPEWEAGMLARFPAFAADLAKSLGAAGEGEPAPIVETVDLGQGFAAEIQADPGLAGDLELLERQGARHLLHDLGVLGEAYLRRALEKPAANGVRVRILVNLGALASFVSFSAVANALHGDGPRSAVPLPTILAFPGEGNDRALSLLYLRADSNYRIPRV